MDLELHVPSITFARELFGSTYTVGIRIAPGRLGQGWTSVRAASVELSDPAQRFAVASTDPMDTLGDWSATIAVPIDGYVLLHAELRDASGTAVSGEYLYYRWPARQFYSSARVSAPDTHFTVTVYSSYGSRRTGRVIYARRGNTMGDGSTQRVNVSGSAIFGMIHPMIPMPQQTVARVVMPGWVTEPNNAIAVIENQPPHPANPAVLPAWDGDGDPDAQWLSAWESEICINFLAYRGAVALRSLSGQPSLENEITWDYEVVDVGSTPPVVEFTRPTRGMRVRAIARGEGEVRVFASYRGERISELRALVRRPVTFAARTIVLLPTEVQDNGIHAQQRREMEGLRATTVNLFIRQANEYLRQVALRLPEIRVPDPAPSGAPGTRHTDSSGLPEMTFERRTVDVSRTVDLSEAQLDHYAEPYGRTRTVTFLVVHSIAPNVYRGYSSGIPGSAAAHSDPRTASDGVVSATFTDRGSPSTSWIPPNGLPPGPAAEPQDMRFIVDAQVDRPVIYLVRALNPAGQGLGVSGFDGKTMAHELGHVLGLLHRGEQTGHDGLPAYGGENLMADGGGSGDLDIAQAKVMWASPLIRRQR